MNYELEVMSSNPTVFNSLTGTQPPLVAGSGSSKLLATYENYNFSPFNKEYEDSPFTLEVWFRPVTNSGEIVVVGHATEGVIWNGTSFILRVRQDAGVAESAWTPKENKSFHVAMVYTPGQAQLYVDATVAVTLTLPDSPFSSTTGSINVHGGSGTAIYDSLALYNRALPGIEIGRHYLWAKSVRTPTQVASANGGNTWTLMHQESDIYATVRFDSANWPQFFLNGLGLVGDRLIANEGGGTWMGMVPLSSMVAGITAGVSLTYDAFHAVLSYSTDASAWTPVMNGAVVLEDVDVTDKDLFLRVDLPEEGWIDSLSVSVLNDRSLSPFSGSTELTYKSVILDHESLEPLDYADSWGASFDSNAFLVIPASTDSPVATTGTTEMWVKFNQFGSAFTFLDGETPAGAGASSINMSAAGALEPGGGTMYINGVARASGYTLTQGVWYHLALVEPAPVNINTFIGRPRQAPSNINMTVGHVARYPQSMTADEVASLYSQNVGSPTLRIDDGSGVTMTEKSPPVAIYAQSWTYVSGGS